MAEGRVGTTYVMFYNSKNGAIDMKVWIVSKHYNTGEVERVAAFFEEDGARAYGASCLGEEGTLLGLEAIEVMDEPQCQHDWKGAKDPTGGYQATCAKCGETQRNLNA